MHGPTAQAKQRAAVQDHAKQAMQPLRREQASGELHVEQVCREGNARAVGDDGGGIGDKQTRAQPTELPAQFQHARLRAEIESEPRHHQEIHPRTGGAHHHPRVVADEACAPFRHQTEIAEPGGDRATRREDPPKTVGSGLAIGMLEPSRAQQHARAGRGAFLPLLAQPEPKLWRMGEHHMHLAVRLRRRSPTLTANAASTSATRTQSSGSAPDA